MSFVSDRKRRLEARLAAVDKEFRELARDFNVEEKGEL